MTTEAQKRASEKYRLSHKDYYNKKSREYAKKLRISQKDYKARIDKAIEYVKKEYNEYNKDFDSYQWWLEDLLNILQNGSEDNE